MRVGVVGLGLIGGSIALALGARGHDRDAGARERARRRGIDAADSLGEAVRDADVVVVAVPTDGAAEALAAVAEVSPRAVLTDVASLKRPVLRAARTLPGTVRFVGGHPMAGSTARGVEAADPALFLGRAWLLVPSERSDAAAMAVVGDLARAAGARPLVVSAQRHDELMTAVSHLPLAVAASVARSVAEHGGAGTTEASGPGLLDTTRLAMTPPELALELAFADAGALARAIEWVRRDLRDLQVALRANDELGSSWIRDFFETAALYREELESVREESTSK